MLTLKGENIQLRALEPEDLHFLQEVENNEDFWAISETQIPFSTYILKNYLENAQQDIYQAKQLRLVICSGEEKLGFIDVFEFDPSHRKAGIGILIAQENQRKRGFASESIELICKYCFKHLKLHQVYANVLEDNLASIKLFEKAGFNCYSTKKDWVLEDGKFKNELLYQLINHVY
ncbi:GNAT family N-acetyltransferase [Mesonia sp. K7]|uniref:GNAT family N-acetyltransferase n=1 Tax=Mesonia sp. K7 TaxID=2218606 RepID=UPI000DA8B2DF|nr:GNAT family N-acetyltransferase [Mesonia sp. K7]PZD77905.1 GNAT family N-acetyltransferase [Mesonia sp. K7]